MLPAWPIHSLGYSQHSPWFLVSVTQKGTLPAQPWGQALFQLSSLVWVLMTADPYFHPRLVDSTLLQASPDLLLSPRFQIRPLSLQQTYTCFTENVYTRKNFLNFPPSTSKLPFTPFSLILEVEEEQRLFSPLSPPLFSCIFILPIVMICFSLLRLHTNKTEQINMALFLLSPPGTEVLLSFGFSTYLFILLQWSVMHSHLSVSISFPLGLRPLMKKWNKSFVKN